MNLVTGATGIVGSHVVLNLLTRGQNVVATRRAESDVDGVHEIFKYYNKSDLFTKITWRNLDVLDYFSIEEALIGIEKVYHCAGMVSFSKSDRKKLKEVNEIGTRNMVNACLQIPDISFCHVSSISTINNLDYKSKLDETVFWKTSGEESDYAISKYNAEREVWRAMEENLKAVIVNPGVILGPGFWNQSSGRLFKTGKKGNRFYTSGKAGYIDVNDVAQSMISLVENRHFGNRYILIEGNYELKEVLSALNQGFLKSAPNINISKSLMKLVGFVEACLKRFSKQSPVLSRAFINAAFSQSLYSNEKVLTFVNRPFRPIMELIPEICKYYQIMDGRQNEK